MADQQRDVTAPSLSPEALFARLRDGESLTVLDVRDRDEFAAWHVEGGAATAVQIPMMKFVAAEATGTAADLVADLSEPIVVVCGRGEASAHVADLLVADGVDAANLAGGMDAWADCDVAVELAHPDATVLQYQRPASGCLSYLVLADGEAAVVDPLRAFADEYVADARAHGATLRYAVDTHVHADHVSGVWELGDRADATVVLPAGTRDRGLDLDSGADVRFVADGDALGVGDVSLSAVALPGHTSEMTGYRVGDLALVGDSVFLQSVARPDLEAGSEGAPALARTLYRTLHERLASLPAETTVAPGHFGDPADAADDRYVASLGDLRERLSAFDVDEEAFVADVTEHLPARPSNYETILAVNLRRRDVDADDAFTLELGPNHCAVS